MYSLHEIRRCRINILIEPELALRVGLYRSDRIHPLTELDQADFDGCLSLTCGLIRHNAFNRGKHRCGCDECQNNCSHAAPSAEDDVIDLPHSPQNFSTRSNFALQFGHTVVPADLDEGSPPFFEAAAALTAAG